MIGSRALGHHLLAVVVVAGAGLVIANPSHNAPAPLRISAINLTAAEGVAATPGDATDLAWLSQAAADLNTSTENFFNTASTEMGSEMNALNSIYSDWVAQYGGDLSTAMQNLGTLGQDYGTWAEGWFQTVVSLETEMPGTVGPDNTSLCDVITLAGMDMDKWANAMGLGASDLFQNMAAQFTTFDQEMLEGMNSLFSSL
ncbi:hypothetical protein KIH27_03695 [Mycobacterium sp. M1]|uniref:PPE family domain-containing protein n=1 Tax=Mycolicibacter acidiphilus TaxID=2835306 RepID=A0ABS5RGH6_9MYCO|nr:hypothetical protein [Mycolicibacter acidiphilus]MBS9532688.1 hypothetical protein [Mycolicibacter acidiphilus]